MSFLCQLFEPLRLRKGRRIGCLRIRNHCPPTDDFVQLLRQSSLPASKDACAAFPCTSPKSPGGGCAAALARRFVPRVPWKGRVEYWMYFQALYRVLWGKSLSRNQCFLIWRQPLRRSFLLFIRCPIPLPGPAGSGSRRSTAHPGGGQQAAPPGRSPGWRRSPPAGRSGCARHG